MKQQTLAVAADHNAQYEQFRRPTRRDVFLATMEKIVPWGALPNSVGSDLGRERVPDATTLLKFRRRLEVHKLGEALFAKVDEVLQAQGLANIYLARGTRYGQVRP